MTELVLNAKNVEWDVMNVLVLKNVVCVVLMTDQEMIVGATKKGSLTMKSM